MQPWIPTSCSPHSLKVLGLRQGLQCQGERTEGTQQTAHTAEGPEWGRQLRHESVPSQGARDTPRVSGCRGPPSPLAHCQPRSHGPSLIRPQEMASLPGWSFPEHTPRFPTCPERESEHSCFLWSPPGSSRSPDGLPASLGSQGDASQSLAPSLGTPGQAPGTGKFQNSTTLKTHGGSDSTGTPLRSSPRSWFPVCVPYKATGAGQSLAHRGSCKHVE